MNENISRTAEDQDSLKIKKLTRILIVLIILLLIGGSMLFDRWNIIMGEKYCKAGDYKTAIEYYNKEVSSGNAEEYVYNILRALTVYEEAKDLYSKDNMEALAVNLTELKSSQIQYPTQEEIKELDKLYTDRIKEQSDISEELKILVELFSDESKTEEIQRRCINLSEKKLTAEQNKMLEDILSNINSYLDIKKSYNDGNYQEVVDKVSKQPDTYKNYPTKDSIDMMKNTAEAVVEERNSISKSLERVRAAFNNRNYDDAFDISDMLLKENITDEERKEVEIIKSTSEEKILEKELLDKQTIEENLKKAITISASALFDSYKANKIGAELKYDEKMLLVSGVVESISETWFLGTPYVKLKLEQTTNGIKAYFNSDTISQLVDLLPGQNIKILGVCDANNAYDIELNNCNIIN